MKVHFASGKSINFNAELRSSHAPVRPLGNIKPGKRVAGPAERWFSAFHQLALVWLPPCLAPSSRQRGS
jgi:hypothetical protein